MPNYNVYRNNFRSLFKALAFNWDFVFDWTLLRQKASAVQQHSNAVAHNIPSGGKMLLHNNVATTGAAATAGDDMTGMGGGGGKL